MHSDAAFPDDEIVGVRGLRRSNLPGTGDVPRVVDTTAETLGIQFEKFLEEYVRKRRRYNNHVLTDTDTPKTRLDPLLPYPAR